MESPGSGIGVQEGYQGFTVSCEQGHHLGDRLTAAFKAETTRPKGESVT